MSAVHLTDDRKRQERAALLAVLHDVSDQPGVDPADAMWGAARALLHLRDAQGFEPRGTTVAATAGARS